MSRKEIIIGLLIALLLALFIAPFSSHWPDGLERVAKQLGFAGKGESGSLISAPLAECRIPGIRNEMVSGLIAGFLGTAAIFGIGYLSAALLRKKGKR